MKRTITITSTAVDVASRQADERNKKGIFKNFAPFMDCIGKINNTQVNNAKDLNDVDV